MRGKYTRTLIQHGLFDNEMINWLHDACTFCKDGNKLTPYLFVSVLVCRHGMITLIINVLFRLNKSFFKKLERNLFTGNNKYDFIIYN